jgi:hypothetical protein
MASPAITTSTVSTMAYAAAAARVNAGLAHLGRTLASYRREEQRQEASPPIVSPDAATSGDIILQKNELFDDPSANVVIETCDRVVFRIHDYFLMAGR